MAISHSLQQLLDDMAPLKEIERIADYCNGKIVKTEEPGIIKVNIKLNMGAHSSFMSAITELYPETVVTDRATKTKWVFTVTTREYRLINNPDIAANYTPSNIC